VFFHADDWAPTFRLRSPATLGRYAVVWILFACGLMCKPMLVTLPFVLLLLDYWRSKESEIRG